MGWWWSSGASAADDATKSNSSPPSAKDTPSQSSSTVTQTPNQDSSKSQTKPHQPQTREEIADAELQSLLQELRESQFAETKKQQQPITPAEPSTTITTIPEPQQPTDISPAALVPRTMSCRQAFDYAFFCQSFGGQFVNVYRYGGLRSCSEHWENWRTCLRSMSQPDPVKKEEMISAYYRAKLDHKYKVAGKPSSEDVWEMRTEPLRGAFEGDYGKLEEAMKAAEDEKRRAST